MKTAEGNAKGGISRGIYRLEGDTLTICNSGIDEKRPTDFTSKPGVATTCRCSAASHSGTARKPARERP